ncbi:hypothetical protein NBRC116601_35250 [Cognatishimia sp. WU-CL00825]|uniref:MarR family winged helix-turn-helix transcriptional regulator n=1 Tax=Cognatishimia sp. WU-CL00825 TaxID=3127658 RepID=UPI003105A717
MTHTDIQEEYDLHSRLGFRLSRISNLMKARLDKRLEAHGLSRLSWCALSGIGLQDITTPSGLADHIGITRQAISRLLLQMRKDGWIEQSFDQSDGRSRRLTLTKQGYETLEICRPVVEENQTHFASKISPQELAALDAALNALLQGESTQLDDV